MEKSAAAKPLLNLPLGKAALGGVGLTGLAAAAAVPGALSALFSPQVMGGALPGIGAGAIVGGALGRKLGRGGLLAGLAGGGLGGVGGYKAIDSAVGDRSNLDQFLMPYGGLAAGTGTAALVNILNALARKKGLISKPIMQSLPARGLLGAGAGIGGSIGTAKALDAYRSKEAKLLKKASVAADGMNKEAFGFFKKKAPTFLQRLGIQNAEGRVGRFATSVTDKLFGLTGGMAGLAGGAIGAMNAPEGEGLSKGLGTGAGLLAAILGGRAARKHLDRVVSVNKLTLDDNLQHLIGYGGGGVASGLGAAKGVDMLADQLDI